MQTLSVSKVKDRFNEFVDSVAQTREQITITKNGAPAAVLIGADEWESLQETLYWLSAPRIMDSIAEARHDLETGNTASENDIREEFGLPRPSGR
jgi:prevent-host-death family protein